MNFWRGKATFEVLKIGGSCLSTKDDIKRVIEIVKEALENQVKPILIVSAFKGVTDELLSQTENALTGNVDLKKIERFHYAFVENLPLHLKKKTKIQVTALFKGLRKLLLNVSNLRALSPSVKDEILSYGEKFAAEIIAAYLNASELEATPLWDKDAGIITNSNFHNGTIMEESKELVREKLDTPYIPVVAGFFGVDNKGRIVTLGRGGSDYTATFVAAALNCKVTLFKDVNGLMTADPKIVENPLIIKQINYQDALELAYYGLKAIHEKAIMPAMEYNIPIRIVNFYNPKEGTLISNEGETTAISYLSRVIKFTYNHIKIADIAYLLLELDSYEVNPLLLTKGSRHAMSLVVKENEAEIVQKTNRRIRKDITAKIEGNLGLVAAVGHRVIEKNTASILTFLNDNGVQVKSIEQSPSGMSICVLIDRDYISKTTKLMHYLFLGL